MEMAVVTALRPMRAAGGYSRCAVLLLPLTLGIRAGRGLGGGAVVGRHAVNFATPALRTTFSLLAGALGVEASRDIDAANGFDRCEGWDFRDTVWSTLIVLHIL